MINRRLILPFACIILGVLILSEPIRLMAQTAEPTPVATDPALLPTPTLAAPGTLVTPTDPAAPPIPRVHVVQDGENLTIIATNFGVTVEEIAINNYDGCRRPCVFANGEVMERNTYILCQHSASELPQVTAFINHIQESVQRQAKTPK